MKNGRCGKNLTWILEDSGEMIISGTGEMENYSIFLFSNEGEEESRLGDKTPWQESKDCIKKVTIQSGVTSVGDAAFAGCAQLEAVELPDSVLSIGFCAFTFCKALETVNIPQTVSAIGGHAFMGTPWLQEADDIPIVNGILLSYWNDEEDVVIPEGVRTIGECAFWNCTWIKSVIIPQGVSVIHNMAFKDCEDLENIEISGTVCVIGSMAFSGCSSLEKLSIPEGVAVIGTQAFSWCGIKTLILPRTLKRIGYKVLEDCDDLSQVFYCGTESEWDEIEINYSNDNLLDMDIEYSEDADCAEAPVVLEPEVVPEPAMWKIYVGGALHALYKKVYC